MGNKKTSIKPRKSLKKSTPTKIGGMAFEEFSPSKDLAARSNQEFGAALTEALLEGDKEAFQEILEGYLKARSITKTAAKVKIPRTVIYEAMDTSKNPSLESICKIMKAFKNVEPKKVKAA